MSGDASESNSPQSNGPQTSSAELTRSIQWTIIAVALIAAAILIVFVGSKESFGSSIGVSTVEALVLLAATLAGLILLARSLGLQEPTAALGLPKGSVRALLALSLVMVFVSVASWNLGGLFQEDIKRTPTTSEAAKDAVAALKEQGVVAWTEKTGDTVWLYYLPKGPPPEVVALAKDIMTVVATVLVTVVGFYFGTSSTVDGAKSAQATMHSISRVLSGGAQAGVTNYELANVKKAAAGVRAIATNLQTSLGKLEVPAGAQGDAAAELQSLHAELEDIVQSRTVDAGRVERMVKGLGEAPDQDKLNEAGERMEKFQTAAMQEEEQFNTLAAEFAKKAAA